MPAAASPPNWKTSIVEILFSITSVGDKFDSAMKNYSNLGQFCSCLEIL